MNTDRKFLESYVAALALAGVNVDIVTASTLFDVTDRIVSRGQSFSLRDAMEIKTKAQEFRDELQAEYESKGAEKPKKAEKPDVKKMEVVDEEEVSSPAMGRKK